LRTAVLDELVAAGVDVVEGGRGLRAGAGAPALALVVAGQDPVVDVVAAPRECYGTGLPSAAVLANRLSRTCDAASAPLTVTLSAHPPAHPHC
jgi:hypothetical protein